MLRIKRLHDRVEDLAAQMKEWNVTLEQRVADQLAELQRVGRLKRFFSPKLAELIVSGGAEDPLQSHRREVTVVFLDLRGFTAFAEVVEPGATPSSISNLRTSLRWSCTIVSM